MLGLHAYYVKRYFRGAVCTLGTVILLVGTPFVYGNLLYLPLLHNETFSTLVGLFGAVSFYIWLSDFIKIIFGGFKIPVVLKDKI